MSNLIFMLPFVVEALGPWKDELRRRLNLTPTRVDDWDLQMGFRLIGNTGAIRLFNRTTEDNEVHPAYELLGTAVTPEDRARVTEVYQECLGALGYIPVEIDYGRLIDPARAGQLQRQLEF